VADFGGIHGPHFPFSKEGGGLLLSMRAIGCGKMAPTTGGRPAANAPERWPRWRASESLARAAEQAQPVRRGGNVGACAEARHGPPKWTMFPAVYIALISSVIAAGGLVGGEQAFSRELHKTVEAKDEVEAGADIEAKDNVGQTALREAASAQSWSRVGGPALVEYLVAQGADINSQESNGLTILGYVKHGAPGAGYATPFSRSHWSMMSWYRSPLKLGKCPPWTIRAGSRRSRSMERM